MSFDSDFHTWWYRQSALVRGQFISNLERAVNKLGHPQEGSDVLGREDALSLREELSNLRHEVRKNTAYLQKVASQLAIMADFVRNGAGK